MKRIPALLLISLALALPAQAQTGIAWYGTWQQGRAEAARSGRPILLLSAAPQCHGVSGIW
jgi:hypothetical protein